MAALLIFMLSFFWLILGGVELFKYFSRPRPQGVTPLHRAKRGAVLHYRR